MFNRRIPETIDYGNNTVVLITNYFMTLTYIKLQIKLLKPAEHFPRFSESLRATDSPCIFTVNLYLTHANKYMQLL